MHTSREHIPSLGSLILPSLCYSLIIGKVETVVVSPCSISSQEIWWMMMMIDVPVEGAYGSSSDLRYFELAAFRQRLHDQSLLL